MACIGLHGFLVVARCGGGGGGGEGESLGIGSCIYYVLFAD